MSSLYEENYKNLANAIILQAAKDYKAAIRKEYRAQHMEDSDKKLNMLSAAQHTILETTRFFESGWFMELTDLDGPLLLRKIRSMTMEEILEKEEAEKAKAEEKRAKVEEERAAAEADAETTVEPDLNDMEKDEDDERR